jgi:hypothetical protein
MWQTVYGSWGIAGYPETWPTTIARRLLTFRLGLGIKEVAAVAATRGDLGQLAPRKKLLKSW